MMRKFGAEAKAKKVRLVPMRWDAAKAGQGMGPNALPRPAPLTHQPLAADLTPSHRTWARS